VKVKDTASPDDPTLHKYWLDRKTKYGKSYWTDGKLRKVAEQQRWKCPVCGEHLFNGEELETHHMVRVKDDGTDDMDNHYHLHKTCHRHSHSGKRSRDAGGLSRVMGKLSSTVLRGEGGSDASDLPGRRGRVERLRGEAATSPSLASGVFNMYMQTSRSKIVQIP
jgi:hypothetical protein